MALVKRAMRTMQIPLVYPEGVLEKYWTKSKPLPEIDHLPRMSPYPWTNIMRDPFNPKNPDAARYWNVSTHEFEGDVTEFEFYSNAANAGDLPNHPPNYQ